MNASQMKINSITDLGDLAVHHLTNFAVLSAFGFGIVICIMLAMKTAGCNKLTRDLGALVSTGAMGMTVLWMMSKLLTA